MYVQQVKCLISLESAARVKFPWIDKKNPVLCGTSLKTDSLRFNTLKFRQRRQNCSQAVFVFSITLKFLVPHCVVIWSTARQRECLLFKIVNTLFVVPGYSVSIFTIQHFVCFKPVVAVKLREEEVDFFLRGLIWVCKKVKESLIPEDVQPVLQRR